jgi:23S rRNA (pseudouridine1915-N3)-methyltransferase
MRLRVIWFGRPAGSPYEKEIESYRKRVSRRWPAEDLPLRPAAGGRSADPTRALAVEAEVARRKIPGGWLSIALDESGTIVDSVGLARILGDLEAASTPGIALLVGSDLGLGADLLSSARLRLSLGRLTLPHLIARLVLWEQVFRATDILGGGRYHRPGVQ